MSTTVYLFETRSIQNYLFEGGKLRDMIAASNQLDALCTSPLDQVIESVCLTEGENIWFSRRAGGAIYASLKSEEKAIEFQAVWSLYVRKHFPNVEVVQVISEGESILEAMNSGLSKLSQQRNLLSVNYPVANPLVRRSPRTGNPAVAYDHGRKEWIDYPTKTKQFANNKSTLLKKFADIPSNYWPENLEKDFPFLGEDKSVALVHADGNGLGEILRLLNTAAKEILSESNDNEGFIEIYKTFSTGLEKATQAAAKEATKLLLNDDISEENKVPARPIVLGGDDLTMLVRSDLAIPFAESFCDAFEKYAEQELTPLYITLKSKLQKETLELANGKTVNLERLVKLTACAGVCFIKANQPFVQAHDLAESLCKHAKDHSRAWLKDEVIPSSISFHQVSSALIEKVENIQTNEWIVKDIQNSTYELSMGCYSLSSSEAPLKALQSIADLFGENKLNRNALREVASLLKEDFDRAQQRYKRWRELAIPKHLDEFDAGLSQLINLNNKDDLPFDNKTGKSPLVDLLTLTALPSQPNTEEINNESAA